MDVGMVPTKVGRMTYSGDLGTILWVAPEYQLTCSTGCGEGAGRTDGPVRVRP